MTVFRPNDEKGSVQSPDRAIGKVLDEQDRVIGGDRIRDLGLSKDEIHKRVKRGQLYRKQRGVYTAGHQAIPALGRWRAAVMTVGGETFLDGASACALWGAREPHDDEPVHVVCRKERRHRKGVRVHWQPDLAVHDTTLRHGIPVVMPARALLGFAAGERSHARIRRAVNQMLVDQRVSLPRLIELLGRSKGRRGAGRLARVLAEATPSRSELEDVAAAALRSLDAQGFSTNSRVAGWEVDVLFPEARLVVEWDSRYHDNPVARARDAVKTAALEAAGLEVVRLRWRHVTVGVHGAIPALLRRVADRTERFSS